MASTSEIGGSVRHFDDQRKPRILIGACGSVAAMIFGLVVRAFLEWAEVHAIVTKSSCHFLDEGSIPKGVGVFRDENDWESWKKNDHNFAFHRNTTLANWADIMLIAPLSANTLAKIVGGVSDNYLTSTMREWNCKKPMFVAPSMHDFMWRNPLTEKHLKSVNEFGITVIQPHKSKDGEYHNAGAMADPAKIFSTVRMFYDFRFLNRKHGGVY